MQRSKRENTVLAVCLFIMCCSFYGYTVPEKKERVVQQRVVEVRERVVTRLIYSHVFVPQKPADRYY